MSNASLADNSSSSCPLTHQYHYIQYPAYYQQLSQQTAVPQTPPSNNCHCPCSCGGTGGSGALQNQPQQQQQLQQPQQQRPTGCHSHQSSVDVAVIVHRQNPTIERPAATTQSEQSLLNHSYQALQLHADTEEKPLNVLGNSKLNISCDCDLECTCGAAIAAQRNKQCGVGGGGGGGVVIPDAMLGADEITVSESDNNSTMIKRKKGGGRTGGGGNASKKFNSWCTTLDGSSMIIPDKGGSGGGSSDPNYNSSHIDIYSDGESGHPDEACLKNSNAIVADSEDHRPPLPPRPPPARPRNVSAVGKAHRGTGIKKYVVWCLICGGFSCLLGVLFLGVYFLLHSYTITVGNFETVPTFVPATLLILTGLCVMSLARRRNRYSYLIKLSGACGLISALTCALVTVTTTVLHMSRLQSLRECEYASKTRTCTCYSDNIESQIERDGVDKEGVRLVFDSLSDCGVVHGSLYSCLRAIFGLSVAGVLIAVFSCMLVYQLLSHERKKMYWEQLELRCRSLYTSQQQGPPPNMAAAMAAGTRGGVICRCCEQCHAHRQVPLQAAAYPWDDGGGGEPRFWTGQPPGNFYSPNPGGDELASAATCRGHHGHTPSSSANTRSRGVTGWSWPRMPWGRRNSPDPNARFRQTPSSPDSQYGFSNNANAAGQEHNMIADDTGAASQSYNVAVAAGGLPYGVWGPPPPYSDPNSPARRGLGSGGYYQYIQPANACTGGGGSGAGGVQNERPNNASSAANEHVPCLNHRAAFLHEQQPPNVVGNSGGGGVNQCCTQTSSIHRMAAKRQATNITGASHFKLKNVGNADYENTPSDSDGPRGDDRFSNTLPTRKVKKRIIDAGAKSIGPNSQPAQRINVQQVFSCGGENEVSSMSAAASDHDSLNNGNVAMLDAENVAASNNAATHHMAPCQHQAAAVRHKRGVENNAFQSNNSECSGGCSGVRNIAPHDSCGGGGDPAESEVYFADVSSCCNMSVKNDNYYEDANQGNHKTMPQVHHHHHQHQSSNCSHSSSGVGGAGGGGGGGSSSGCNEDYLAQRFGQRENSIRSRLPFPQARNNTDYVEQLQTAAAVSATAVNHMQKEISRQSMCSVESEAKTEFTDLSPATPCSNKFAQTHFISAATGSGTTTTAATNAGSVNISEVCEGPSFVASSFPYCSETQSLEAHRRSTKNIHELMLAPEAHYEVINDASSSGSGGGAGGVSAAVSSQFAMTPQRPSNLFGSKRADLTHKTKPKSKSREHLDAPAAFQSDLEWSDGGCGGGGDRQQRL